jgi:AbrB family looped-hinge helix DNA binding protein
MCLGSTNEIKNAMNDHIGVVTRKGQVTLPVDFRRSLGLKHGDKVVFHLQEDRVVVVRSASVTETTKGIFKHYVDRPRSAEELRSDAEVAIADEIQERALTS